MPTIFNSKDSVFFVGGLGTKAGDADAGGGCTLDAWENGPVSKNLSYVMGTNGEPFGDWNGSQDACDVTNNGSGKVRITSTGNMYIPQIGLIANVAFAAVYANGRYEVIASDYTNWIDIDLAYSSDTTCDVKIGGSFDKAQNAWNNTDATQGYNVVIHSNKSQSKTNGDFTATWNLGTAGGSLTNKSFKRFVGFTTQPEDGGQIIFDGEDDGAFTTGGAGIYFNSPIENVIFENVIVEDAYINWRTSSNVYGVFFMNCEGNSGSWAGWYVGDGRGFVLINCKAKDNNGIGFNTAFSSGISNHCLINCIASGNTKEGFYRLGGHSGSVAIGCIAYNNGNGSTKYSGFLFRSNYGWGAAVNCVSYNNGKHGFEFYATYAPVAINCIAKDNGQWGFYANLTVNTMMPYVTHCCAHGNSSGQFSLPAALPEWDSIEQDPQFVGAASGDFRPRNPAVLRGGKPDINGNPTQMGAILQKYQFGDRERIANMARLRVVR